MTDSDNFYRFEHNKIHTDMLFRLFLSAALTSKFMISCKVIQSMSKILFNYSATVNNATIDCSLSKQIRIDLVGNIKMHRN